MTTTRPAARVLAGLALAAGLLALGGCASVANPHPNDPWEPFNRQVTEFNEGVDAVVLKPISTLYKDKVPPVMRTGVANFFGNLSDAWSFVNSALQGKVQQAADNFARVQINSFVGIFGLFDVASDLNIERHREDFGQTLGHWGVPAGPYLVIPLLGPSTVRDAFALPVDRQGDIVSYFDPSGLRYGSTALRIVHQRSTLLRASSVLDEAALDKYSFLRDAHLQRRRAEIYEPDDPRREVPPPLPPDNPAAPGSQPQPAPAR